MLFKCVSTPARRLGHEEIVCGNIENLHLRRSLHEGEFHCTSVSVQHKKTSKAAGLEQKEGCKVEGEKGANSPACI